MFRFNLFVPFMMPMQHETCYNNLVQLCRRPAWQWKKSILVEWLLQCSLDSSPWHWPFNLGIFSNIWFCFNIFHDIYFMMYISQYIIVLVVSRGIIRDNVIVLVSQQRIVTRIHKENFSRTWFQFIPGRALLKMNNAHHDSLRLTDPCAVFICADSCEERTCRRGSSDQSAW